MAKRPEKTSKNEALHPKLLKRKNNKTSRI